MSALGLDDVDDPRGVTAYAPLRHRRPDDSSIRPILERLSRGEGRVPGPRLVRTEPVQELPPADVESVARSAVPTAARLAIAGAVLAVVGAAAAGHFALSGEDHAAPASAAAAPSPLPKPVQTLSIQRSDRADAQPAAQLVKDDARMPQAASDVTSTAGALPQAAPAMPLQATAPADPSASPLSAWAAVRAASAATGWSQPAQAADQPPPQSADAAPPAADQSSNADADTTAHKAAPVHHAHHAARHSSHHRRAHAARARAAQTEAEQPAAAAETEAAPKQPVKKLPLQAAIDRLFGNSGSASAAPPQQQQ